MNSQQNLLYATAEYIEANRAIAHRLLHHLSSLERQFLLRSELLDTFKQLCEEDCPELCDSPLASIINCCQEAAMDTSWVYLALRPRIASWIFVRIHLESLQSERITVAEFLRFKERLAAATSDDDWVLEFDLAPFSREFYKMREANSIGRGVEFLNRRLSSRLFEELGKGDKRLLAFLQVHRYRDQQLMLNESIEDVHDLRNALRQADGYLHGQSNEKSWEDVYADLRSYGFEPGWGNDVARIRNTMQLLLDILEAPSPNNLEDFLGRIPMIFSLAVLSPHGYFGQANVLGRPDTGGQVVYILDQVRALEKEMRDRLLQQGLNIEPQIVILTRLIPNAEGTTCNERLEPIVGTHNARILRVPFRNPDGEVIPHWISRFEIWPYLEQFALEAERELLAELSGRPDLIIGNYSDGNLVASLMSQRLGITQCNIAHALEKTKYLYSDLYWRHNEAQYHFSSQFTADLIAMNTADFIITSTYQEIAGTNESAGQYESYTLFSMPGLYRVVHGIDVHDPKFNIVSPGADAEVYFSYADKTRRLSHLLLEIKELVFGQETHSDRRGMLTEPDKPVLFTMARMDHIKNITGLVSWYANNEALRNEANLLIVSGHINPDLSSDAEERKQIHLMHSLMDQYQLDDQVRWLGVHLDKTMAGELYRYIADCKGAFVQPATFEAFGLTVIEAMSSGLPTFATCFGGPLEIIEDGISGFHIDPTHGDVAADRILEFFLKCREQDGYWEQLSNGGLQRVEARYTWKKYAERMMTLSRIYGFWKYVSHLEREETQRYLQMFYGLQFRPLAQAMAQ